MPAARMVTFIRSAHLEITATLACDLNALHAVWRRVGEINRQHHIFGPAFGEQLFEQLRAMLLGGFPRQAIGALKAACE